MPFFGTPQRLNVRPSGTATRNTRNTQKNKTKKYLGTHTRRPCGGYWVAPRLLRIGRNERNTTGTQQNTGYRHLTVIYSSFYRHFIVIYATQYHPFLILILQHVKTGHRHTIPHENATQYHPFLKPVPAPQRGQIFTKLNYFSFVSGYENKNRTYYNALSLPCITVRRGCPVPPPQCPFLLSCFSSTCILFRPFRFPCACMLSNPRFGIHRTLQ